MRKIALSLIGLVITLGINAQNKLEPTGNVGIGTTTPDKPLVIKTQTGNTEMRILADDNISRSAIYFGDMDHGSRGQIYYQHSDDGFRFLTNTVERMRILSNGNIGMGVTVPNSKLHLRDGTGNATFIIQGKQDQNAGNYAELVLSTEYSTANTTSGNQTGRKTLIRSTASSGWGSDPRLGFYTSSSISAYPQERLSISPNGNIGIGTTNPDSKLSVNGTIHTKEVKVDLIGWSDFVFFDDYKLPTLQEVENHIKEKGHLKDIPNAKEVKENGVFLGEMDSKLLQKIEELTLYTIAQEKKLKSQESKLNKQNEDLNSMKTLLLELQSKLKRLESEN